MKSAVLYFIIRLAILLLALTLFYNYAYLFLPKYIQDDRFSFVSELHVFLQAGTCFAFLYGGFIYFELGKFIRENRTGHKISAKILIGINVMLMVTMLFLSLKV